MPETPLTTVRFSKDLMTRVVRACAYTNHSARAFVEECVEACLDLADCEGDALIVPNIVELVRRKRGKKSLVMDAATVKKLIREELTVRKSEKNRS